VGQDNNRRATRVGLARTGDRRQNVYTALDLVRSDLEPRIREQVLLKPNFLSSTNQFASTHADAIRGALEFLSSCPNPPREVVIAEGANEEYSGEAFDTFGYRGLIDEFDISIRLVDLNQETRWQTEKIFLDDGSEYTVHIPETVLDCPCTISMAVAKTHDVCCVTLAMKNMIMGTIRKEDRVKVHGFRSHDQRKLPQEARRINVNLIRLARHLIPDIAVVDGTVGLQGNGPGGTDAVDLDVAAAGADVFAVDAVMAKVMGFEPLDLGLMQYGHRLGMGVADLTDIQLVGMSIEEVRRSFKRHEATELQLQWHDAEAEALLS
jgi:uncharacterized protein (DUF362 family)